MTNYAFFECYVKCPVEQCEKRDSKGLYRKARKGEIKNMTGLTAPYEAPENPELTVDTNRMGLDQCVDRLIDFLILKKIIFSRRSNANYLRQAR